MFPFTFKRKYTFNTPAGTNKQEERIISALSDLFIQPQVKQSTLHFRFFKNIFKRHRWLDEGYIDAISEEGKLIIDLHLNFITAPVIYLLLSVGIVTLHFKNMHIALALISIVWTIHGFLFLWTVYTFKTTISKVLIEALGFKGRII